MNPNADLRSTFSLHVSGCHAGYENIVQVRALLEGVEPNAILGSWHDILPEKMEEWSLDRAELVRLFGTVRDDWMQEDMQVLSNPRGSRLIYFPVCMKV